MFAFSIDNNVVYKVACHSNKYMLYINLLEIPISGMLTGLLSILETAEIKFHSGRPEQEPPDFFVPQGLFLPLVYEE